MEPVKAECREDTVESREDALEFLRTYKNRNWFYSGINDTWYTDLNETLTLGNFPEAVIRNIDEEIMPAFYKILNAGLPREPTVKSVIKLLEGLWVSELIDASKKATQETDVRPEIREVLPHLYGTKMCILTGVDKYPADVFVKDKICPLYYQNVPAEKQGGHIAVIPTIHCERNGRLTGEVVAVPDNEDRGVLFFIDLFGYLGYEDKVDELKKLTKYPVGNKGLNYKF